VSKLLKRAGFLPRGKDCSLFGMNVSDEEKKLYNKDCKIRFDQLLGNSASPSVQTENRKARILKFKNARLIVVCNSSKEKNN
jgi:hypothetical protein